MTSQRSPDRADWPGYWRAIRNGGVMLVTGAIVVAAAAFIPRPDGLIERIAMEVVIGAVAVAVAVQVRPRVDAWWERRAA